MLAKQLSRFGVVGGAATLVHILIALLCYAIVQLDALTANFIAFCGAWLVSYVGNYWWTFGATTTHVHSVPRFALVSVVSLVLNQGTVWIATEVAGMSYLLALCAVLLIVPATVFVFSKYWTFKDASKSGRHQTFTS